VSIQHTKGVYYNLKNHTVQIWGLYVDPEQRGKGIAKALMSSLLVKLGENKDIAVIKLEVNTDQESAKKLYEHFGFKVTDTHPLVLGDSKEHQVTNMEKPSVEK
jgi:ribosomal protein S18 acetylase RimI-like enzyme